MQRVRSLRGFTLRRSDRGHGGFGHPREGLQAAIDVVLVQAHRQVALVRAIAGVEPAAQAHRLARGVPDGLVVAALVQPAAEVVNGLGEPVLERRVRRGKRAKPLDSLAGRGEPGIQLIEVIQPAAEAVEVLGEFGLEVGIAGGERATDRQGLLYGDQLFLE